MVRAMQDRGVSLKAEQLPVSAIVRCPLLAIRWRLPNQKVRRAQIKFKSSQDYDAAYSHLHQLGLRMTSSNDGQARTRPYTPSTPMQASKVTPSLAGPTYTTAAPSGGLSCPPSRLADITNRPLTASDAPISLHARPLEAASSRPVSALTGNTYADRSASGSVSGPLTPPVLFARPTSATTDLLEQSSLGESLSPQDSSAAFTEELPQNGGARPAVPILSSGHHSAEAPLPPRRELPFQRLSAPLSAGSDTNRPSSRPSTGVMGPPPLPMRVATLRPTSARDAALESELPQLPQPTVIAKSVSRLQETPQPPRTPDSNTHTVSGTTSSPYQDTRPVLSPSPTANCSPDSSPSVSRRQNFATSPLGLGDSSGNDARIQRRVVSLNTLATPTNSTTLSSDQVEPEVGTSDINGLKAYIMQSEERRRAVLNDFIFRHLESDDFLALVEDMETCWARVALGMR